MGAIGPDRSSEPVRSIGVFTKDLLRLAGRFAKCGVRTVAMESTSVYGIPIFELLEERGFEVFLVNARDAKHVPGRKTDAGDAQWLQRLHACGLLRASFRPNGEIVEMACPTGRQNRMVQLLRETVFVGKVSPHPAFGRNASPRTTAPRPNLSRSASIAFSRAFSLVRSPSTRSAASASAAGLRSLVPTPIRR